MSPSRKAKRTAIVQPTRDLGFELLPELDLNRGGRLRTLEEVERHYIRQVLQGEGGHIESAARKLGIPRSSLYHKLKRYQRRSA
jgi:DNA-binding NtrC family response regulator